MKVGDQRLAFEGNCEWIGLSPQSVTGVHLLHFWSMSCPGCHGNMPHLQKLRDEYSAKGLTVIGVHRPMSEGDLDVERVRAVAVELGVTEPCALDNDHSIGDMMGVTAWPTYFLFDEDHKLRRRAMGNFGVKIIGGAIKRIFNEDAETSL